MKRVFITTAVATLAAIAWGIAIRGDVAFGGEMIIAALVSAYSVIREDLKA